MNMVQMWTVQDIVDLIKRHSKIFEVEPWGAWKVGKWEYWLMKDDEIWICHPVNTGFDDDEMVAMLKFDHLDGEWSMDTRPDDYLEIEKVVAIIKRQVASEERRLEIEAGQKQMRLKC